MTQNSQAPPQGYPGGGTMNLSQLYDAGLDLTQGICSFVALPVEYALRPHFGTRYFNPVSTFLACIMMLLLAGFGALSTLSLNPFRRPAPAEPHHGLISLAVLSGLFFLGNLIHGPRLYRRMLHPETEENSEYEGRSILSFLFAVLPYGSRFWPVRIVYEPLTVLAVALSLSLTRILDHSAATYLCIAAVFLCVKNYIEWYRAWLQIRMLLDGKAAAPIIASVMKGTATEEDMARVHLAGFSKTISPDIKAAAIARRTGVLPAEVAHLVSPLQKPGAAEAA